MSHYSAGYDSEHRRFSLVIPMDTDNAKTFKKIFDEVGVPFDYSHDFDNLRARITFYPPKPISDEQNTRILKMIAKQGVSVSSPKETTA